MTIKITAQQLSMRFKNRVLFHIPELSIGPNDAIYLKGDNGVGKTTLLKILSGLLKPTTGKVIAPHDSFIQRISARSGRRDVVYLHQAPYLFDGSVYQNVAYGIRYQKMSSQDKRAAVIFALRKVGLETLADEHISVLSGGEKQRVAMARAWILTPSILLMDEPSASLDQESIDRLVLLAKDLLEKGSSIVITSHQKNALTDLCRKQWWIKESTLIESPLLQIITDEKQESDYATSNAN
ncbi:energy-coupling factor ABC transporter ATP-binding protein [Vibrio scophthalmi]|uniref:ABC-type tungstate transport system ATP-binding protein n=2 Tax=Vibrio scophthalmi TaxID=45658 RepID=F9RU08_9VIBR|nr:MULTISPECIES: energy-coupling factor ABC transporter ATP-binding protein [Vibrio]ANS85491.1 Tungstate-importing ATPase [Vibrio scophthalmi]ANU36476.1 Tungstate-importing ATPase [Vibrio scophthalmi]EGU30627.1 ABC-type tungstate transport system ATP-binding protein [Vibrio scophthalmi LMG 19158]EGU35681.1 ABC-type tungstate transport system ATP-binding protein [Vibrio sp. N418]MCY9803548.1 energy-coupling factor ABC transporter ATP-binding protein [Vibrio scophthalmi]